MCTFDLSVEENMNGSCMKCDCCSDSIPYEQRFTHNIVSWLDTSTCPLARGK